MKLHRATISVLAVILSGCAGNYTALEAGNEAITQNPAAQIVGTGQYAYRFVVRDPHTGKPWPNRPYALTTTGPRLYRLPFVPEEKNVYQGISDADGHTSVFRIADRLDDNIWDLRERFGSGPFGETFLFTGPTDQPLADAKYRLTVCSTPPRSHEGYTYPDGKTAYAATEKPEALDVSLVYTAFGESRSQVSCDKEAPEKANHP